MTNENVLQIVKDSVSAYFERHPEANVISVSSNDNTQYCQCENCSKIEEEEGAHSGTMIRFVNEVAKEFPDKQITENFKMVENGEVSPQTKQRLSRFVKSCQMGNITLMNEMGYKVDEFVSLFEKTLKRAAAKNLASGKKVDLLTKPKKYADENPQALTNGALGGSNFYANWLGFEGNNLEAIIDLGEEKEFSNISAGFLQVTNHIVFFPENVTYWASTDGKSFKTVAKVLTQNPITKESKRNDIEYFEAAINPTKARYLKIEAKNVGKAPAWHNAAGLPVWIFVDEVIVN